MRRTHAIMVLVTAAVTCTALLQAQELHVGSAAGDPGASIALPLSLAPAGQVVGLQFDLVRPGTLATIGVPVLASSNTDHRVESRDLGAVRRVVQFSPTSQRLPSDVILEIPIEIATNSPAGGPTLALRNLIFTDAEGRALTPTVRHQALDAWRLQHFTDAELGDPLVFADDRDPEGDGQRNLAEFATAGNPKVDDVSDVFGLQVQVDDAGGASLDWTFWQPRGAESVVQTVPQVSTNLVAADWDASPDASLAPTGRESAEAIEMKASLQTGGDQVKYMRLHFRRLE